MSDVAPQADRRSTDRQFSAINTEVASLRSLISGHISDESTQVAAMRSYVAESVAETKAQIEKVSKDLTTNNTLTQEIRDILKAFKLLGIIAKWFTGVVAAGAAALALGEHAWNGLKRIF